MAESPVTSGTCQVHSPRTPLSLVPSRPIPVHLDPAHELFIMHCGAKGLKPRTIEIYNKTINQFSAYVSKPLVEVNRLEALAYLNHLREHYNDRTVYNLTTNLRTMYAYLLAEDVIESNPFRSVRPKFEPQPMTTATDEQINSLLISCASSASPVRNVSLVKILTDTGCRREECSSLRTTDVLLDNRTIRYRVSKSKPRIVPLSSDLANVLKLWLDERGYEDQSLWDVGDPYQLVHWVVHHNSQGQLTPHSLRRRFAVSWLRNGGSETSLMRIAGWNSRAMIGIYTQAHAEELAHAEFNRLFH